MTTSEDIASGDSTSSASDMPNALAIRKATARVGLALLRSTWLNIERLTPEALASMSSDQCLSMRSCLRRREKWLVAGSSKAAGASGLVLGFRMEWAMQVQRRCLFILCTGFYHAQKNRF